MPDRQIVAIYRNIFHVEHYTSCTCKRQILNGHNIDQWVNKARTSELLTRADRILLRDDWTYPKRHSVDLQTLNL